MNAGEVGRVSVVNRNDKAIETPVAKARLISRLSQAQFAALMGVSVHTLQDWEQGRRKPSGAAQTLLRIRRCYGNWL